ncbi:MAG TPA: PQQ-dependent sugar dehydrogenase, partial [Verrucomicrobiae bacterium]
MPLVTDQTGFSLQPAFNSVFKAPVAVATPPGETNRIFILEKDTGRILVITNIADASSTPLEFLNIGPKVRTGGEMGLLGLAFHPNYATNGYFYVYYTGGTIAALRDVLARYTVSSSNSNAADSASELLLINQPDQDGDHNAGDLHFGPDGYLYLSLGDEGCCADTYQNSQRIDGDFFSGILRIDVDQNDGNLPPNPHPAIGATPHYSVPADNPFIGATTFNGRAVTDPTKIRTEFWAVGLRNPWRFSFDPATGELWCADVGENSYEEVNIITKGGNYGWSYFEGKHLLQQVLSPPPGVILIEPVFEYSHALGVSVTGGVVYRGEQIPEINGAYIFGDYGSGRIWALRTNELGQGSVTKLTSNRGLSAYAGVAAFGTDPSNGDVLVVNVSDGIIRRLVYTQPPTNTPVPSMLADTGVFSDLTNLTPHPGIVPYDVNLPFWSDGAEKLRWFSVPNPADKITFHQNDSWQFPTGTVFVKNFDIQTNDNPVAKRRLETRILVRTAEVVYGVTYRWTNEFNAVLVNEEGFNELIPIKRGATTTSLAYHYPGRDECLMCHNAAAGWILGFNTRQLNRNATYDGQTTNQIAALASAGYLNEPSVDHREMLALAGVRDQSASREFRVRSYLDVNCAHCHRPGGVTGNFDARISTPTDLANLINGELVNNQGNAANKTLVPKNLSASNIRQRMIAPSTSSLKMPPIGRSTVDSDASTLFSDFILGDLVTRQSFAQW